MKEAVRECHCVMNHVFSVTRVFFLCGISQRSRVVFCLFATSVTEAKSKG